MSFRYEKDSVTAISVVDSTKVVLLKRLLFTPMREWYYVIEFDEDCAMSVRKGIKESSKGNRAKRNRIIIMIKRRKKCTAHHII